MRRSGAILSGLLCASCTVGPRFVAPHANTPAAWSTEAMAQVAGRVPASPVSAAPMPEAQWWRSFGDATLSSLIERTAVSNLDVRQAVLRIAEARAQRDIAFAPLLPDLSANASYTKQRISEKMAFASLLQSFTGGAAGREPGGVSGPLPGLVNPFNQYQYGFDASWEIDLFGRTRRAVEAASADTDTALESGRDVLVSMLAELARTYIDLRAAQLRLAVLEESLATERDTLQLTRDRRTAGLGNDLDVENAAAQMTSTESQLPLARARITTDINGLSFLLALDPGALKSELIAAAPVPVVPPQVPIGLPADIIRRRPDIREAEAQLHAATARVGVAVADLFPSLTLNAAAGMQSASPGDLTNWASRFFSVGPALDLPIFQGGARQATVRLQNVRVKEAAVTYARTVLAALNEVENDLTVYGPEQSRRDSLAATVAHSREALALARQRYESGVTSFLDVLVAERNYQQSQLTLADSTAAVATDLVALYKALGGGWSATVPAS